jgi:glycosyltransferase involved in cell wall biosynthesis
MILSSHDARKDLAAFDAEAVQKSHVLHFVANPPAVEAPLPPEVLAAKYQVSGPYFHLPNQFWAHKNHRVVLQALKILRERGTPVQVLATGRTEDHRQPAFFGNLTREIREAGVGGEFRVLGLVPYAEMIALMQNSVALLNPSLFEGWSSSVEEGKSLGKRMIISDLAVHREQDPPAALYFNPKDPAELAGRMAAVLSDRGFDENALREKALLEFPGRRRQFARDYCSMVGRILSA